MDRKLKWRTFWLVAITVFAVCTLIPSFVPNDRLPIGFTNVFDKKINLGLDLQGGLHIVYSIDLDKAVDDKGSELKRDIEAKMDELGIEGKVSTPRTPPGAVTIMVDDPADKARIDGKFLSDYDEIIDTRTCPADQRERAVCVHVSSDYADGIKEAALEQAVRTIRGRIDEKGVAEPTVITKGDQIIVELPGLDEETINRVKELIARTAKLEFKIVDDDSAYMKKLYGHVAGNKKKGIAGDPEAARLDIEASVDLWQHDDTREQFTDYYLSAGDEVEWVTEKEKEEIGCISSKTQQRAGETLYECKITGRTRIERYVAALAKEDPGFIIDDDHQLAFEEVQPGTGDDGESRDPYWRTYYLHRTVELAGSAVSNAYVYWNPTTNRPEVLVEFNRWGGRRFGELTSDNVGKKMAIILDDEVNSAPVIQGAITGGRSSITMGGNTPADIQREAQDLVSVLKTGSLPAPLNQESSSVVGPLLGHDAIQKAKISFVLGGLLVLIIMIFYYRTSGAIAMAALILNILYMLAILAGFGATLTLPGIAAVVLTIGMAVDAQIIIYERVREELRLGKSVRGAVDAGFARGFAAIFDGQLTTAAAGYVLLQYGSGPIRGFAVMLLIGIACTLFTATWVTKIFFEYYIGRGKKNVVIGI